MHSLQHSLTRGLPLLRQSVELFLKKASALVLSVPVRIKIIGIIMLPVLILGLTLNYWIQTGLADWLSYLLSDQRVEAAMQAGGRSVTLVTFLAALASILFALLLTFLLTWPLQDLNAMAQAVSDGKLDSRAKVWASDEIGQVARSVNTMIDRLVSSQTNLAQANRRLEAMNRVAMAAGRELGLPEVLSAILQGSLEVMGLQQGWVYLNEGDGNQFYLAQQYNLPESLAACLAAHNRESLCGCQNDLVSGNLSLHSTLRPRCERIANNLPASGSLTHLSIPLQARGQVLGVINLLCEQCYRPQPEDLELLTAIGAQASEIVANAWLHERLREKEAARRALLESLVRTQEDERTRLARELHDGAGQTLTTLLVQLKTLERQTAPGPLHEGLLNLQNLVAGSVEEIRELSYRLRPATLEEFGLALALQNLAEEMIGAAGMQVTTRLDSGCHLPAEVETALFRIAQESLTNIIRHARAQCVAIRLLKTPTGIGLRIDDDGQGFDPDEFPKSHTHQPHLGLIGIQERAEMLGGSLVVLSAPGAGTSIQVQIPLPEAQR